MEPALAASLNFSRLQGCCYGRPMRYDELPEMINDGSLKLGEKQI